jgi:CDGSH-type Zn-finger protein/uncharacterized Fe-S cluster protein YjdI
MSKKHVVTYPGKDVDVKWHGKLCIHIGECGRAKGDLFVGGRKPWCDPNLASNDEVQEIVLRCPTGALSVERNDGSDPETAESENTVHVAYNGPLFVRGQLDISAASEDTPGLRFRAALCRCGASKNKPFCDNSHEEAGFKDYGAVGETGDSSTERGGKLSVSTVKNGPLFLKGRVTIVGSGGRRTWQGKQVALCRCGASNNKPFCDGRHKEAGFEAD